LGAKQDNLRAMVNIEINNSDRLPERQVTSHIYQALNLPGCVAILKY
jgi:hypothetical protein